MADHMARLKTIENSQYERKVNQLDLNANKSKHGYSDKLYNTTVIQIRLN